LIPLFFQFVIINNKTKLKMIWQLIKFVWDYAHGRRAELNVFVTWWEFGAVLIIIGLIVRLWLR
jgi:hypothetical protein